MESTEENIKVVYNSLGGILITLGDHGIELTRAEAEQLFTDLGHALMDQDMIRKEVSDEGKSE